MKKEIFKSYRSLTLFDCSRAVLEVDGYFPMINDKGMIKHLTLKDTVISPKGWDGSKIEISYRGFTDETVLTLCFGKPFSNNSADTAKVRVDITKTCITAKIESAQLEFPCKIDAEGVFCIAVEGKELKINNTTVKFEKTEIDGYFEMFSETGELCLTDITIDTKTQPYTQEQHIEALEAWRHVQLDKRDKYLDKLEKYITENPEVLPEIKGEIIVPNRLVDKGEEMTVRVVSYGTINAALTITHDSFSPDAQPQPISLDWVCENGTYYADILLKLDIPGNTRIEFWVNGQRIVRQIAVLDKGYMAVIPWIGDNKPYVDEELHRYDIPGDYWVPSPAVCEDPAETVEKFSAFIKNYHKYGDRSACVVNGKALIPDSETDSLFELDKESQERGFAQIKRQMELLGYKDMELIASYTPDAVSIEVMEKLGVKGMTSLCAWQNWQDGGWKINHCGVSNQPYYPANDDFRRSAKKRDLMCFTMGNSSCNRNYSIMALDGCPTNIVPGERYLENYVVNQHIQRFYDTFDGYIADCKNNDGQLVTVTIAIEAFCARMDWNATNEMALRYMAKKAASEKIVFTSAADVSDYHKRKNLDMQEAYFFQPDYYYGYHNGTMPGRIDDRLEADTRDYLAVIRRSSMLPMYFYDYTEEWDSVQFEDTERNEFGQIDPDEHKPSECFPKQVYTEDMTIRSEIDANVISIYITSETAKKRMVTGVFDVPFEKDFELTLDKSDATAKKIYDQWTGNTHLFVDLGALEAGETVVKIEICGTPKAVVKAEDVKDGFAAMWFGDHAYMRSCDKEAAIKVTMDAPDGANLRLISGKKVFAKDGKLCFTVNTAWFDEAPILYDYDRSAFVKALETAKIEVIGTTTCSRWSGQ